jgi:hypothetical protein
VGVVLGEDESVRWLHSSVITADVRRAG